MRNSLNTKVGSKNQFKCEMIGGMVGLDMVPLHTLHIVKHFAIFKDLYLGGHSNITDSTCQELLTKSQLLHNILNLSLVNVHAPLGFE